MNIENVTNSNVNDGSLLRKGNINELPDFLDKFPGTSLYDSNCEVEADKIAKEGHFSQLEQKNSKIRVFKSDRDLIKLHDLLFKGNKDQWAIGDEIVHLIKDKKWKIKELAKHFKYASNRLTEFYLTAKTFTEADRDKNYSISFSHYELARKVSKTFPQWSPSEAFAIIQKDGLTRKREATRHFADILRSKNSVNALNAMADKLFVSNSIIDNCHFANCLTIAGKLDNRSVKISWLDLPYGQYAGYKDGKHTTNSASVNTFSNGTTQEVLDLYNDLFGNLGPKTDKGGVMLVCRPGGYVDPLHTELINLAHKYDWVPYRILTWHKGGAKLGNGTEPYTTDTENIWVLHRSGDTIINHNNSSRSVVLPIRPVRQKEETADETHLFEKPVDLGKFLIDKHSYEGELIFDACGCSASFSVAAIELRRHFVYCEINEQNFTLGKNNIAAALNAAQEQTINKVK
jgi:DNA modification methylase